MKTPQPMGTLCQDSITCTAQKYFLMVRRNLLCSSLRPLSLVLALLSLLPPHRYLQPLVRSPQPPLLQAELSQLPQSLLIGEVLQTPVHLGSLMFDSFQHFPLLHWGGPEQDTVQQVILRGGYDMRLFFCCLGRVGALVGCCTYCFGFFNKSFLWFKTGGHQKRNLL